MNDKTRVRFAPSPTGPLHIGGLRTALYNFLFARQNQGTFILRIEDTDQARLVPGAEEYIIKALAWCGLSPDEGPGITGGAGPYRQSERKSIYQQYITELIKKGKAYYAFDTVEEIEQMRVNEAQKGKQSAKYDQTTRRLMRNALTLGIQAAEEMVSQGVPYTVRMLVPENRTISIRDRIRGEVRFDSKELDDKVIMKNDGLPTYHFANVVDDHLMEISHVIRGEEWLSSTAHHVLLYEAFGWSDTMPEFAHLPLILKPGGKGKLSKRDGQKFGFPVFPLAWQDAEEPFEGFDTFGFDPKALINFLAFLGWNPGTEQEIFSLDELTRTFSLEQISKGGAHFDYDKALWYNSQYIMQQDDRELAENVLPFVESNGYHADVASLTPISGLLKERIQTYRDFPVAGFYFFSEVRDFNQKILGKKWNKDIRPLYEKLVAALVAVTGKEFTAEGLKVKVSSFIEEENLKFGDILPLLRIALTGDTKGPDLFEMMEVMGKPIVNKRLDESISIFDKLVLL